MPLKNKSPCGLNIFICKKAYKKNSTKVQKWREREREIIPVLPLTRLVNLITKYRHRLPDYYKYAWPLCIITKKLLLNKILTPILDCVRLKFHNVWILILAKTPILTYTAEEETTFCSRKTCNVCRIHISWVQWYWVAPLHLHQTGYDGPELKQWVRCTQLLISQELKSAIWITDKSRTLFVIHIYISFFHGGIYTRKKGSVTVRHSDVYTGSMWVI